MLKLPLPIGPLPEYLLLLLLLLGAESQGVSKLNAAYLLAPLPVKGGPYLRCAPNLVPLRD